MKVKARHQICPKFERTFSLIGKRWTGLIIRILMDGKCRFVDMEAMIPNLSGRMLAERLRELEREGIITRTVYQSMPIKIEYELTEKGLSLAQALDKVQEWAETWID